MAGRLLGHRVDPEDNVTDSDRAETETTMGMTGGDHE
jgi:hypothetical protein